MLRVAGGFSLTFMKAILSKIGEPLGQHFSLIGKRPRIHYAIFESLREPSLTQALVYYEGAKDAIPNFLLEQIPIDFPN